MATRGPKPVPLSVRFWKHVDKTSGCWLWTASVNNFGYGRIWDNDTKKQELAHRISWKLHHGALPDGVLDHLCRVPACVRPDHLEDVTQRENILRGVHASALATRTDRCKRGHSEWGIRKNGHRWCRACAKEKYRTGEWARRR